MAFELHRTMQTNRSKRYRAAAQQVDRTKDYSLADSVATLKKFSPTKFDQTVTLSFRLGVDPKQSDQMVRGTCPLPHGSGKQVRVLVFAEGEAAKAAKEAGAEFVGMKDLIEKCQGGVQEVKAGRVEFKLDKNGNVAVPVGKFSFEENALVENGNAVIEAVVRARPASAKGRYVEGMTISATMSPAVRVDPAPYLNV